MPRPKKIKVPKINKRKLVERLVEKPANDILPWLLKEYSVLKSLEKHYPLNFLAQLVFRKKLPSLAVLFCDFYERDLKIRFQSFNYVAPQKEEIILGEKVGEDFQIQKKQSLRDLLN